MIEHGEHIAGYATCGRARGGRRDTGEIYELYLAPVYGALGAWWVLGEVPGWYHAAGAALILPSIWLATRR